MDTDARIRELSRLCHKIAVDCGWWPERDLALARSWNPTLIASKLALVHAEVSEALEDVRNGDMKMFITDKPQGFAVEMADVLARVFDLCEALEIDVVGALLEKIRYNRKRPFRHGGKAL